MIYITPKGVRFKILSKGTFYSTIVTDTKEVIKMHTVDLLKLIDCGHYKIVEG
jgi:hypothetical protein